MAQHAHTDRSASTRKDDVIQIRAAAELKAMLSRAASLRGQKLSEFMLASARREAEAAILLQKLAEGHKPRQTLRRGLSTIIDGIGQ